MNVNDARFWTHNVLPTEAAAVLMRAAAAAKEISDPAKRAHRIDSAIHMVRTNYPQYFKE
ncbi:hypothetical protein [Burkholderia anthina]|uniref:hypothetical protein n=1 Tax=Burkholderia anthina TaxID=179879 RepID=UPI001AA08B1E|nr:hypothetical protein [Burkholderia anthina]QTD88908.1 hypothetical protein J4G50_13935 [Burkholderia anthina]